jgi:hypothetical protein
MGTEKISPSSNVDEVYKKGDWLILGPLSNVISTADYITVQWLQMLSWEGHEIGCGLPYSITQAIS